MVLSARRLSRDGACPQYHSRNDVGRRDKGWRRGQEVLSLTYFIHHMIGVGTSFQRVRFIISSPRSTFFSSSERRKTINPDALEAGPYPKKSPFSNVSVREEPDGG